MKQGILIGLLFVAMMLCVGCSQTQTRIYDVSVRNETGHPITIWLTKDGPPVEKGWRSPEQIALAAPAYDERLGGILVLPGKTAYTNDIKGEFMPAALAWLRVYDGQYKSFSDLLAISPKSSQRMDYALYPGKNFLVVKQTAGKLAVESEGQQVAVPGAK